MSSRLEDRLARGEPMIRPREVLALGFCSTFMILVSIISSVILIESYMSLVQLLVLPPLAAIYSVSYRSALVQELRYELVHILLLEPEQVDREIEIFEKAMPPHWFNRFLPSPK